MSGVLPTELATVDSLLNAALAEAGQRSACLSVALGGGLGTRRADLLVDRLTRLPQGSVDLWAVYLGADDIPLLTSGVIRHLHTSYLTPDPSIRRNDRGLPDGISLHEWPEWLFLTAFRGAAMGLPFIPYRLASLPEGQSWSQVQFNGAAYRMVPAPSVDVCLVRVAKADSHGNAVISDTCGGTGTGTGAPFLAELDVAMVTTAARTVLQASTVVVDVPSPDINGVEVTLTVQRTAKDA